MKSRQQIINVIPIASERTSIYSVNDSSIFQLKERVFEFYKRIETRFHKNHSKHRLILLFTVLPFYPVTILASAMHSLLIIITLSDVRLLNQLSLTPNSLPFNQINAFLKQFFIQNYLSILQSTSILISCHFQ